MLHQRAYRENSRLVQFFSLEVGRIDGVVRGSQIPLYQPVLLYASGKSALKSLSKIEWVGAPKNLQGSALFAGFYANELLVRLAPLEEAMPNTFAAYSQLLDELQSLPVPDDSNLALMTALRRFESVLLTELGYAINFAQDFLGVPILPQQLYRFTPNEGFSSNSSGELGEYLLAMADSELAFSQQTLPAEVIAMLTRVYRKALAVLLNDKPLKSRELWIAQRS
ncbi:DNA repair protein RecO [Alkanindiges sp. WGS2144]|uniref:DNA repair protein RecO n=1 Tax=Alkanindiges sp. WGS2144 TaxID=3366808 RepID=UPI003753B21E